METIYPAKLKPGDRLAIIAPSRSFSIISQPTRAIAERRFAELGLEIVAGKYLEEIDELNSGSVEHRLADLHWAFTDRSIKAVLTVIGGFNTNQLLSNINWEIIKNNPKVFCGYSDITALNNAIFAKTGLVTYSGPHYSTFGQELHFDYTLDYFKRVLMADGPVNVTASKEWSDDLWFIDQQARNLVPNSGFVQINEGQAKGRIIGGNISTFNLLQGTEFMPSLSGAILFLEDDGETYPADFDRRLQSIIHLPEFRQVRGLVIGRFQKESKIADTVLGKILQGKRELETIPVVTGADFGHTDPKLTIPIGGEAELMVNQGNISLTFLKH